MLNSMPLLKKPFLYNFQYLQSQGDVISFNKQLNESGMMRRKNSFQFQLLAHESLRRRVRIDNSMRIYFLSKRYNFVPGPESKVKRIDKLDCMSMRVKSMIENCIFSFYQYYLASFFIFNNLKEKCIIFHHKN